ncbi:hypothetical protein Trydic_g6733 [Trypoxylus dichotomus]
MLPSNLHISPMKIWLRLTKLLWSAFVRYIGLVIDAWMSHVPGIKWRFPTAKLQIILLIDTCKEMSLPYPIINLKMLQDPTLHSNTNLGTVSSIPETRVIICGSLLVKSIESWDQPLFKVQVFESVDEYEMFE